MPSILLPKGDGVQPRQLVPSSKYGPVRFAATPYAGTIPAKAHPSNATFRTSEYGQTIESTSTATSGHVLSFGASPNVSSSGSSGFTILFAQKYSSGGTNATIFSEETSGTAYRNGLYKSTNWLWKTRDAISGDGGTAHDLTVTAPTVGVWETRALVWDKGSKYAYKDGVLDASASRTVTSMTTSAIIGFGIGGSTAAAAGYTSITAIPVFIVIDRALTAAEILEVSRKPSDLYKIVSYRRNASVGAVYEVKPQFFLPRNTTKQPAQASVSSSFKPSPNALIFNAADYADVLTKTVPARTLPQVSTPYGLAVQNTYNSGVKLPFPGRPINPTGVTFALEFWFDSTLGNCEFLSMVDANFYGMMVFYNYGGFGLLKQGSYQMPSVNITTGWYRAVLAFDTVTDVCYAYTKNLQTGEILSNVSTDTGTIGRGDTTWYVSGGNYRTASSKITVAYIDSVFKTYQEMAWFLDNPWQLFKSQPKVIVPPSQEVIPAETLVPTLWIPRVIATKQPLKAKLSSNFQPSPDALIFNAAEYGDIVTGKLPTANSLQQEITPYGVAIKNTYNSGNKLEFTNRKQSGDQVTFAFEARLNYTFAQSPVLLSTSSTINSGQRLAFISGAVYFTKGGVVDVGGVSVSAGGDGWYRAICSSDSVSGNWYTYCKNLITGVISSASGNNTNTPSAGETTWSISGGHLNSPNASFTIVYIDTIFKPYSEMAWFLDNPWQIFKSQPRTLVSRTPIPTVLKHTRIAKPQIQQELPKINWAHPLARGLCLAIVPGFPELLSNTPLSLAAGSSINPNGIKPSGRVIQRDILEQKGTYYALPSNHPVYNIKQDITMMLSRAAFTSGYSYPSNVTFPPIAGALSGPYNTQHLDGSGGFGVLIANTQYNAASNIYGSYTDGVERTYIGVRNGTTISGYIDGVDYGTSTCPTGDLDWGTKQPLCFGCLSNTSSGGERVGWASGIFIWDRALSKIERDLVSKDPWVMFQSPSKLLRVPSIIVGTPQLLVPVSDITKGTWSASSGPDLYPMLDESTPDSADYIYTSTHGDYFEVGLTVGSAPTTTAGHILHYQLLAGSGSGTIYLKQGATVIASWPYTLTGSDQTVTQTLTSGQAAAITDYSSLRVAGNTD